jgi:transcriptional regulator with XRE-family HTH domain
MSGFNRVDTTANRLKIAMEEAGKRQTDLVRETGIDKGAMSNYLKGKYEPKQDVVNRLAIALGVSEMWLWGYDCKKERVQEEIKKEPMKMAQIHIEMVEDIDLSDLFQDFKLLDARERKIVKDLAHSLAETKKAEV